MFSIFVIFEAVGRF